MGELGQLQQALPQFQNHNIEIVAISVDSPEELAKAKTDAGATFRFVSDADQKLMSHFGIHDVGAHPMENRDIHRPSTLLIDNRGRLAWAHYADNYRVRPRPDEVLELATAALQKEG